MSTQRLSWAPAGARCNHVHDSLFISERKESRAQILYKERYSYSNLWDPRTIQTRTDLYTNMMHEELAQQPKFQI